MSKFGLNAVISNRPVAFAVMALAFAYGAGWKGAQDVSVLRSEAAAFSEDLYGPVVAASPTDWRIPYPEKVWTRGEPPAPAPADKSETDESEVSL